MSRKVLLHDDSDGRSYADALTHTDLPEPHFEQLLAPVTTVTIQHALPRRMVRCTLMDLDYYEAPRTVVRRLFYGDNGDGTYFVTIDFVGRWSGVVRLDY